MPLNSTITPYEAWVIMNSIRLHFTQPKPINGLLWKVFTEKKYEQSNDIYVAARLSKKYQTLERFSIFLASNFVMDQTLWFTDLEVDMYHERYLEARRITSAPLYQLRSGIIATLPLESTTGRIDGLGVLNKLLSGEYTPEEVILIDRCESFLDSINGTNYIVAKVLQRLERYRPFVTLKTETERNEIREIIQEKRND